MPRKSESSTAKRLCASSAAGTKARIKWQPSKPATERGQATAVGGLILIDGPKFFEKRDAIANRTAIGRIEEVELADIAQTERCHLQDDRREVGTQDLWLGELGPLIEIVLGIQPQAHPWGHSSAPARALVGRGLRDWLDGQALHLESMAISRDSRGPSVDHETNPRNRQRGFGHVGRQHDSTSAVVLEDAVLLGCRQPRIQRQHFGVRTIEAAQRVGRVVNLALATEKHQHVARAMLDQFINRVADRLHLISIVINVFVEIGPERPIPHLYRKGSACHLDDRSVVEVLRKSLCVDGGRRNDHFEIGPPRQELLDVTEQEVDVETALVGLVDDQRVVARERAVVLNLGEQDSVGHHLDQRAVAHPIGETNRVANQPAELGAEFVGHPFGNRSRGDSPRLGVANESRYAATKFETELR